jgi:hypothetical protein
VLTDVERQRGWIDTMLAGSHISQLSMAALLLHWIDLESRKALVWRLRIG